MTRVTVHGGVGEIGGNKVLLEGEHGSVMLDFGLSFSVLGQYYCEFCQPRPWNYVGDQLALGLLPDLPGVYRPDLLGRTGRPGDEPRGLDGVFVSHAHLDHVGMVPALRPDVPVHLSLASHAVLRTLDAAGKSFGMPDRFLSYTPRFELVEAKRGGLKRGKGSEVRVPRAVEPFEPGVEVQVAEDLSVVPMTVDHSLPGACGFLVHVDGGTWAYTGDLRFHGTRSELSRGFVDAAASEDVAVLVTEGTRVAEPMGRSEAEVRERVTEIVSEARSLVLANYPARDLDRILSFHAAARDAGRELVVDLRQALLLENMASVPGVEVPRLGDGLRVYARRQNWGVVGEDGFPEGIQEQDYGTWERPFAFSEHRLLDREIYEVPDRYVVFLDFFHLQALLDLKPGPGSVFVRSLVEPFNEEMELDEERVRHWMELFDLEVHQVHASGHACGEDLRGLVEAMEPRVVIPVHTERPDVFKGWHPNVREPSLGVPMEP